MNMRCFSVLFLCMVSSLLGLQPYCARDKFKRAHTGVYIVELETGREVYAQNAEQFFATASLQKIPLSAAAIAYLGPEYRFRTELSYEGKVDKNGNLHGNVWIRGGGDPTFSTETLAAWEAELKKLGILKIEGKIYADASCLESALASPYWYFEDLGNYYGAGPCALTVNENYYKITFQPGAKEGDPAIVLRTEPEIPGLIAHNEVTTGPAGSGDQVYVFGTEYSPIQYYRGTVPLDQSTLTVKAAIPDPSRFCASTLDAKLPATKGIEIVRQGPTIPLFTLCRHDSPPVKEIVKDMNLHSINLYAEHLLKAIGSGKGKQGCMALELFLKKLGIPVQVRDGSGLARTNLITPKGFVALLCEIRKNSLYRSIYESFPEPGKKGSLRTFPALTNASLRAKTGSMSNVNNLGGYLTLSTGKEYAFALFCNNYEGPISELTPEMHNFLQQIINNELDYKQL